MLMLMLMMWILITVIINLIMSKEKRSPKSLTEIKQNQNLETNSYAPTPLAIHLPNTLPRFESSLKTIKTVIQMKGIAQH